MDLCRVVIRKHITKDGMVAGEIEELKLPNTLKDFLVYKDTEHLPKSVVPNVTSRFPRLTALRSELRRSWLKRRATGNIQTIFDNHSATGSALEIS